jgi:hypothetical protein
MVGARAKAEDVDEGYVASGPGFSVRDSVLLVD